MSLDKKKTMALAEKLCLAFPELRGKSSHVNSVIRSHIYGTLKPYKNKVLNLSRSVQKGDPDAALEFLRILTDKNRQEMYLGESK